MPNNQDPNRMQQVNDQLKAASSVSRETREAAGRLTKSWSTVYEKWEAALKAVESTSTDDPSRTGLQNKLRDLDGQLHNILNRGKGLSNEFEQLLQRNVDRTRLLRALEQRVSTSPAEKAAVEKYLEKNNLIKEMEETNMNIRKHMEGIMEEIKSYKDTKMDVDYLKNLNLEEGISRSINRNLSTDRIMQQEMEARRKGEKVIHQPTPLPPKPISKQSNPHTAPAASSLPKQSSPSPQDSADWIKSQFRTEENADWIKEEFTTKKKKKVKKAKIKEAPAKTLLETPAAKYDRDNLDKIKNIIQVNSRDEYLKSEPKGYVKKSFTGLNTQMQDAKISLTRNRQLDTIENAKYELDHSVYDPVEKAARLYEVLAKVKKEIKTEVTLLPSRLLKQVKKEMATIESKFPSVRDLVIGKTIKQDKP